MIHLTPAMLEAAYELLRTTPPFRGWKLPHADEVCFKVSRHRVEYGLYEDNPHTITISQHKHSQLQTLLLTMAHEMTHMRERIASPRWRTDVGHGDDFKRLADQVCKKHGFDRGAF